jgi:hypothetical protein
LEHLAICQGVYKLKDLKLISEVFKSCVSEEKRPEDELREELKKVRKELERKISLKKVKQLFKKKAETTKEVKESLLEAIIEINNNCKQM